MPMKTGLIHRCRAASSQMQHTTARMTKRPTQTRAMWRSLERPRGAPDRSAGSARPARSESGSAIIHRRRSDLGLEDAPDALIHSVEFRVAVQFGDLARPRQLDLELGLDAPGPARHDDDAIGERDRLGEVMGNEDDSDA